MPALNRSVSDTCILGEKERHGSHQRERLLEIIVQLAHDFEPRFLGWVGVHVVEGLGGLLRRSGWGRRVWVSAEPKKSKGRCARFGIAET